MVTENQKPPKWGDLSKEFISTCVIDEPFFYFIFDNIDNIDTEIPSAFYIRMSLGKMTRYKNDMAFISLLKQFDYNGKLSLHDLIMRLLMLYVEFCTLKKPDSSPYDHIKRWIEYTKIISEGNFPSVVDWCNHRFRDTGVGHYFTNVWRSKRKNILLSNLNLTVNTSRFNSYKNENDLINIVNTQAKIKSAKTLYDISKHKNKFSHIYDFAIETGVFTSQISEAQFIVSIEKADISEIYNTVNTKKYKLKLILKQINLYMGNKPWYKEITASINSTPSVCSGANPNDEDWKELLKKL